MENSPAYISSLVGGECGVSWGIVGKVEEVCSRWRSLWKIARPLLMVTFWCT